MELSLSFSSLRLPAVIRRSCKASSHENRLIPIISSTTKNNIQLSSNFPSKCSATNKLNLPGIYGESLSSKPLLVGQHKRNSVRAAQVDSADSDHPVLAKAPVNSAGLDSVLHNVSRFAVGCYKFARPYALHQAILSNICLYARVLVENPQFFKWHVLLKAFPGYIAIILAYAYYNGINQIFDIDIDRVNKPYLPIPAGDISLKEAWFLMIFDVVVGLLILRWMNADLITTSLYCLGLVLATFYSTPPFRFKASSLATIIVIPLITGIIQNVGVLYAARTSLGLPFWWSPSTVFITAFVTVFFVPVSLIKDLTDVEGDMKHNIRTFTAMIGHRNIAFISTGLLLVNYIGAMAASIYMPQAFNRHVMLPFHAILSLWLLFEAWNLDKANYAKEASANFFQFLWKLLGLEFIMFPFM